jgi:hypothetical protein
MVIRKILDRLLGVREPISFEQTPVSFAQAEFEAAQHQMREIQRQDEAAARATWLSAKCNRGSSTLTCAVASSSTSRAA